MFTQFIRQMLAVPEAQPEMLDQIEVVMDQCPHCAGVIVREIPVQTVKQRSWRQTNSKPATPREDVIDAEFTIVRHS